MQNRRARDQEIVSLAFLVSRLLLFFHNRRDRAGSLRRQRIDKDGSSCPPGLLFCFSAGAAIELDRSEVNDVEKEFSPDLLTSCFAFRRRREPPVSRYLSTPPPVISVRPAPPAT
jgi:hypothetical protein